MSQSDQTADTWWPTLTAIREHVAVTPDGPRWGSQPVGLAANEAEQDRRFLLAMIDELASAAPSPLPDALDVDRLTDAIIAAQLDFSEPRTTGWFPRAVAREYARLSGTGGLGAAAQADTARPDDLDVAARAYLNDPDGYTAARLRAILDGSFMSDESRQEANAALRTLLERDGMDVDRLARALRVEAHNLYAANDKQRRDMAASIATEYARLAQSDAPRMRMSPAQVEGGTDMVIGPYDQSRPGNVQCPVCKQIFSIKGLAIHKGMTGHA